MSESSHETGAVMRMGYFARRHSVIAVSKFVGWPNCGPVALSAVATRADSCTNEQDAKANFERENLTGVRNEDVF
jgi:hypothetical protein